MYTKFIDPKKNKERVVDQEGYVRRVAALCISECTETKVLLITSKSSHENWIIPGGGIELCESAEAAVVREAKEEAGVICKIVKHLGVVEDCNTKKRTDVFHLNVLEELDEWEDSKANKRLRKWFTIHDAYNLLTKYRPEQVAYLDLISCCTSRV